MMLSVTILGSGSAGNCALVESEKTRLLIDGGLSARQITGRLADLGVTPDQLDGILVTHEHGDHVCGLQVFCRKLELPVYCNSLTSEVLRSSAGCTHKNWRIFQTSCDFEIGDICIQSFPVPHDAVAPVGYTLTSGGASLGFLTDLGYATHLVVERVRNVHTLVIETNHCEKLLIECDRRPWPVKQRIMSRHGHLSNDAAAKVVRTILGPDLKRLILGHLSRDCNTEERAVEVMRACLAESGASGVDVFCAAQKEVSPRFELRGAPLPPRVGEEPPRYFTGDLFGTAFGAA